MIIIPFWITVILISILVIAFVISLLVLELSRKKSIVKILAFIIPSVLLLLIVFGASPIYEEEYDRTVNLYALDSDNDIRGTFLLGGGNVHNIQCYIGYTNIVEDDYKQIKFDASNSVLRLKDDETPRAEIYKECKFISYFNLILLETMYSSEKAILYIPHDGLKNEYSVNY